MPRYTFCCPRDSISLQHHHTWTRLTETCGHVSLRQYTFCCPRDSISLQHGTSRHHHYHTWTCLTETIHVSLRQWTRLTETRGHVSLRRGHVSVRQYMFCCPRDLISLQHGTSRHHHRHTWTCLTETCGHVSLRRPTPFHRAFTR